MIESFRVTNRRAVDDAHRMWATGHYGPALHLMKSVALSFRNLLDMIRQTWSELPWVTRLMEDLGVNQVAREIGIATDALVQRVTGRATSAVKWIFGGALALGALYIVVKHGSASEESS